MSIEMTKVEIGKSGFMPQCRKWDRKKFWYC